MLSSDETRRHPREQYPFGDERENSRTEFREAKLSSRVACKIDGNRMISQSDRSCQWSRRVKKSAGICMSHNPLPPQWCLELGALGLGFKRLLQRSGTYAARYLKLIALGGKTVPHCWRITKWWRQHDYSSVVERPLFWGGGCVERSNWWHIAPKAVVCTNWLCV
jgi:hypothetical protein